MIATYSYQSGSNRISGISGAQSASYTLDANGNTTLENSNGYTYNQNQRLIHAAATQAADYQYNAQGQRAIKIVSGQVTVYHYDQGGQLVAETDAAGILQAEYLYLDGQPLAKIDSTGTSYIHPDHLGTPQLMTDSQGTVVWQIQARPFGDSPSITGTQTLNLRFPGQYYDAESGLHQNWFRDYQPNLGRYVEADPIGLRGGKSLYAYVGNSPANIVDRKGLLGLWVSFGGGASAHIGPGGLNCSLMTAVNVLTLEVCSLQTCCIRGGAGIWAAAQGMFGVGYTNGKEKDNCDCGINMGGISGGAGADFGYGEVGGVKARNIGGGINFSKCSITAITGAVGGGAGISVGLDVCGTKASCINSPDSCTQCKK